MRLFDGIFRLLETGTRLAPAENCFLGDIELVERDGRLTFTSAGPGKKPARFMSYFRWVFLAIALGVAWLVHKDLGTAESAVVRLIAWVLIACAVGMGLAGAFVVVPFMLMAFRRMDKLAESHSSLLPSFDVVKQVVYLPNAKSAYAFGDALGFKHAKGPSGWNRLHLLMRDGSTLFLFNYPTSTTERMKKILERVSEVTGVQPSSIGSEEGPVTGEQ